MNKKMINQTEVFIKYLERLTELMKKYPDRFSTLRYSTYENSAYRAHNFDFQYLEPKGEE